MLPSTGVAKVNWDTIVNMHNQKMGIGILVQDNQGEVLACLNASQNFNSQPILAEGLALWRVIEFSKEMGIPCVQLEGDAQILINAIISTQTCEAWYGGIVEDAKAIMQQHAHWTIGFVHRGGNQASHHLAKLGLSLEEEQIQMQDSPISISNVVFEDKR